MSEDKSNVKLGDGLADGLKSQANQEMLSTCNLLLSRFFEFIREKVEDIDFEKLFSKKEKDEILSIWSSVLAEKRLVPKGYAGLPDEFLVDNLHQDGYRRVYMLGMPLL